MIHHVLMCPVPGSGPGGRALYGVPPWGCTGPVHWIVHGLGIDSQVSYFYDFVSGSGPMFLTFLVSVGVFFGAWHAYQRWTCQHSLLCLRHGKHDLTDPETGETHHYCHKHHPAPRSKRWSPEHRRRVWERAQAAQQGDAPP